MEVATRNYMSIGEILVTLKAEFPDVTISKIRFLEGEGLIDPERTASGYRKFHDEDVDRLRTILRMQRDEYLPLKVIKERLEQTEDLAMPPTGLHMSVEELSAATGVDRNRIRELETFGILCSHGLNGDRYYDGDDFVVLSIVKDFFKYGIEPPMLRQRNPDARKAAAANLSDLATLARKLKQALLRSNLSKYLVPS